MYTSLCWQRTGRLANVASPVSCVNGSNLDMDSVCKWGWFQAFRPRIPPECCRWLCKPPASAGCLRHRSLNTAKPPTHTHTQKGQKTHPWVLGQHVNSLIRHNICKMSTSKIWYDFEFLKLRKPVFFWRVPFFWHLCDVCLRNFISLNRTVHK